MLIKLHSQATTTPKIRATVQASKEPAWIVTEPHPTEVTQTNGMVERFNGGIEEVLQSHHFRSGEELETTLHRHVRLYNQQFPQSALPGQPAVRTKRAFAALHQTCIPGADSGSPSCVRENTSIC